MEYISVREAAKKWGVSMRRVQYLCSHGQIKDVGRMGRMWLIPCGAKAPDDLRQKSAGVLSEDKGERPQFKPQAGGAELEVLWESGNYALFFEIIRTLPLVMHIFRPDGTLFYGNEAYCHMMGIKSKETYEALKKLNAYDNPDLKRWGILDVITRALKGEVVHAYDIKVPLKELAETFGDKGHPAPQQILYQNFHSFPIRDANGNLRFVATIFETSRSYSGRDEVIRGKEYIENHWKEKFNLEKAAGASSLSRSHFIKMFKSHTGITPHKYQQELKIRHVCRMLLDAHISVADAFDACGMEYNSHYLEIFRVQTGMTPLEYRKNNEKPFKINL